MLSILPFLFLALQITGCDIKLGSNYHIQRGIVADTDMGTSTNDGFTNSTNDTLAWGGNDSIVTRPDTIQVTDTTDPPSDDDIFGNTDTGTAVDVYIEPECTVDGDCGDGWTHTLDRCVDNRCVYPPRPCIYSTEYNDCNDRVACNGHEYCTLQGFCAGGTPLECDLPFDAGNTRCHQAAGCYVSGEHTHECTVDLDCAPGEYCDTGTHFCVEAQETCDTWEACDDWNGCTVDRCMHGVCEHPSIGCVSDNPSTKAMCNPDGGAGCEWSPYILIQARLAYPHNQDEVWIFFAAHGAWHGPAPYIMHLNVEEACEGGIWVDFKDRDTGQWYTQLPNPPAEQVEYLAVDNVVINSPFVMTQGDNGGGIYINKTQLGCPLP
ncbi:MAG TPA: hypothetical protein PK295_01510 [Candidatus Magasanikbacteria bacterium]|nr:hypothetical protein [Candidatus Magasanikbacteria bacterium]